MPVQKPECREVSGIDKLKELDELLTALEAHRRLRQQIVFTNGCFDVLHRGHIECLKFCRRHGNVVVVGLNTDRSVRRIKGPSRPVNPQQDRAAVLGALACVDYVILFDEPDPLRLIEAVCPEVLVKGADWAQKGVIGRDFVEGRGGRVELAPLVEGRSSSRIIERLHAVNSMMNSVVETT